MSEEKKEEKSIDMTPDIMEALKGFLPASGTVPCTIQNENVPKEYWPTFQIKPFDNVQKESISKIAGDGSISDTERGEGFLEILKENIVDWDCWDLSSWNGEKCTKKLKFSIDIFDAMPDHMRIKVLNEAQKISGLM